jgi:uncharacterized membrane protein YphA (DoxX/SURF4 family)
MTVALTITACVTALGFALLGLGKIKASPQMQERAAHVGFSVAAYRRIGALELLAAAGLLVGLAVWPVGAAAAAGLLAMLVGAVIAHQRARDTTGALPAVVFAGLTITYLVLLVEVMP